MTTRQSPRQPPQPTPTTLAAPASTPAAPSPPLALVLEGTATLVTEAGETVLRPGMCAGFRAGGAAHHLVNRSDADVVYLEVGDRTPGDEATYPQDDLQAVLGPDGAWRFSHRDGQPY